MGRSRIQHTLVAGVAGLVALVLGAQPALAVPAASGVDCRAAVATQAEALKLAHVCNLDIEVTDARTPWQTTHATEDGRLRLTTTAGAARVLVDGTWLPTDNRVTDRVPGDGRLDVAVSVNQISVSDGTKGQPLARLVRDGQELVVDAPFDLTTPVIDNNRVTYPGVAGTGVDLVVTVNPDATGITYALRFADDAALARASKKMNLKALTFPVTTGPGLQVTGTAAGAEDGSGAGSSARVVDGFGQQVFSFPAPSLTGADRAARPVGVEVVPAAPRHSLEQDPSRGTDAPGRATSGAGRPQTGGLGATSGGATVGGQELDPTGFTQPAGSQQAATVGLRLKVDTKQKSTTSGTTAQSSGLTGMVFPLSVTAQVSGSANAWTAITRHTGSAPAAGGAVARSGWALAGLDEVGFVDPDQVTEASLTLTPTGAAQCTEDLAVQVWRTTAFDELTDDAAAWRTWAKTGFLAALDTQRVEEDCGRVTWDVTDAARALASADAGTAVFGTRVVSDDTDQEATDAASDLTWDATAATLMVEYEPMAVTAADDSGQDLAAREANLDPVDANADVPDATTPSPVPTQSAPETVPSAPPAPVEDLPEAGSVTVPLAAEPTQVAVGGMDLTLEATAGQAAPDEVQVTVADQPSTEADGITGVQLEVTDSSAATAGTETRHVTTTVSYDEFAEAAGADWGSRLQVIRIPACAQVTPDAPECQPAPVPTTNDEESRTLTADLEIPAAGSAAAAATTETAAAKDTAVQSESKTSGTDQSTMSATTQAAEVQAGDTFAVSSGVASSTGDWSATPMSMTGSWSVSGATGSMGWSYPMTVPSPAAGPSPQLSIGYSSAALTGRVSGANNQSSWIGDGWDLTTGFVERRYTSCAQDQDPVGGGDANNATRDTGDLCWDKDNATLVLGGRNTDLVKNTAVSTAERVIWTPKDDDGTLVEQRLPGGANASGRATQEYWRVTTPNGTVHTFGRDERYSGDTLNQGSRWTVPVYGNHSGEPGYQSAANGGFAASDRDQVWRFMLDHVTDTVGNTMTYSYKQETNQYGSDNNRDGSKKYVRGGWLDFIEYGTREGSTGHANAPYRVNFTVAERCFSGSGCPTTAKPSRAEAVRWRDTPMDLICISTTSCKTVMTPAFFSRKRLTQVTTNVRISGAYVGVDRYNLDQRFRDPGDGTGNLLWLQSIQRTALGDTTDASTVDDANVSLGKVHFAGVAMPGRADYDNLSDGLSAMNRYYVTDIVTESGARTSVQYSTPECASSQPGSTLTAQEANTKLCFPVRWQFPGEEDAMTEYFNAYIVRSITQTPDGAARTGGQRTDGHGDPDITTHYTYFDPPKWARVKDRLLDPADEEDREFLTWSDFRGYEKVETTTGPGLAQTRTLYLRGMGGEVTAGAGGQTVTVADDDRLAGTVLESWTLNGTATLTKSVNKPTIKDTTSNDGVTAGYVDQVVTLAATYDAAGDVDFVRKTVTERDKYGNTTQAEDLGDLAVPGDQLCTRSTFHAPSMTVDAKFIATALKETITRTGTCGTQDDGTPGQIISATRMSYDDADHGTAPTRGLVTASRQISPDADKNFGTAFADVPWSDTNDLTTTMAYDLTDPAYTSGIGRPVATTNAAGRTSRSDYTLTGGVLSKTTSTSPDPDGGGVLTPHITTTNLDLLRGVPMTVRDPNDRLAWASYDAMGRLRLVRYPQHASTQPSIKYAYTVSATGVNAVTTETLRGDGTTYHKSVQLYDGLLRPVQTQTASVDAADPGRVVTDTRYDDAGRVYQTQGPWFERGGAPGPGLVSTSKVPPSTTRYVYDQAGRTTAAIFLVGTPDNNRSERWRTTTVYDGATTLSIPPAGASPSAVTVDAQGRTTALTVYEREGNDPAAAGFPDTSAEIEQLNSQTTTYGYTPAGLLTTVTDGDTNSWTYTYDLAGRQTKATDPDNGTTETTYDEVGQVETTKDANGAILAYTYDNLGRRTSMRTGTVTGAIRTQWRYDMYATGPNINQVVKGLMTAAFRHTPDGTGDADTDPDLYITAVTDVDAAYRPLVQRVILPTGNPDLAALGTTASSRTFDTTYTYTHDGQVATTTLPAAGNLRRETVTTQFTDTSMPEWTSSGFGWGVYVADSRFNAFGDLLYTDLGNTYGTAVSYHYEHGTRRLSNVSLDRERVAGTDLDLTYSYDPAGNIIKVADQPTHAGSAADVQCYTYDGNQRLTNAWTPTTGACTTVPTTGTVASQVTGAGPAPYWQTFEHDLLGNRTGATTYDPQTSPDPATADYAIGGTTPSEQVADQCLGTGLVTGPHQVAAISTESDAGTTCQQYTYDAAGNTTKRTSTADYVDTTQDLTWDPEGELTGVSTQTTVYAEPEPGPGDDDSGTTTTPAPVRGAATTTTDVQSMIYTADGDRILRKHGTTVTAYIGGGQEITLTAGNTNPSSVTAVRYYSFAGQTVAVRTGMGLGGVTSLVNDLHGTPLASVHNTQWSTTSVNKHHTLPYGQARGGTPPPGDHRFLGAPEDPTGLTMLGARYYDPAIGRFLSVDPIMNLTDPEQWNGYAYANNNPVTHSDPTGLCATCMLIDGPRGPVLAPDVGTGGGGGGGGSSNDDPPGGGGGGGPRPDAEPEPDGWCTYLGICPGVEEPINYPQWFDDADAAADRKWREQIDGMEVFASRWWACMGEVWGKECSDYYAMLSGMPRGTVEGTIADGQEIGDAVVAGDYAEAAGLVGVGIVGIVGTKGSGRGAAAARGVDAGAATRPGTSIRRVGDVLESPNDVIASPRLLEGRHPGTIAEMFKDSGWEVGSLRKGRNAGSGWTSRELNARGSDYTGRYIQWHPGSRRHFGGAPYWKVSDGTGGTVRFPQ